MNQPEHSLQELGTSVAAALVRSEERMSHVQRQLAGWPELPRVPVGEENPAGWAALQAQADALANGADAQLEKAQQELVDFVQQTRALITSLQPSV